MTQQILHCHPDSSCSSVHTLSCDVLALNNGDVQLNYYLAGDLNNLLLPKPIASRQADKLWEHSCFEAFIGVVGEQAYHEYNFSPSKQWAAYCFCDYREIMAWKVSDSPKIECLQQDKSLTMSVTLAKEILPPNPQNKPLNMGLSTVIETKSGELSYWALKHASEQPDFHHRDSFIHQLKTS